MLHVEEEKGGTAAGRGTSDRTRTPYPPSTYERTGNRAKVKNGEKTVSKKGKVKLRPGEGLRLQEPL